MQYCTLSAYLFNQLVMCVACSRSVSHATTSAISTPRGTVAESKNVMFLRALGFLTFLIGTTERSCCDLGTPPLQRPCCSVVRC